MTVEELLVTPYLWSAAHGTLILGIAISFPVVATLLAWILRGGKTDEDGLVVADFAAGTSVLVFAVSSLLFAAASLSLDVTILEMQVAVLLAPLICCLATVFGVSRLFRLRRLYTIGLLQDVMLFLALLWAARWFMGKFWGWGMIFYGGTGQILIFLVLGFVGLVFLFRRVFRWRKRKRA